MNRRLKVYMGRDGFSGVSRIGQTSYLEKKAWPQKRPAVYMGSGGVNVRTVLAKGGIVGGGVLSVGGGFSSPRVVDKPKPEKRLEKTTKATVEKEKESVEAGAKAEKPSEAEVRKSMMEKAMEAKQVAAVDRNPPEAVEAVGVYAPAEVEEAAIESQAKAEQPEAQAEESGEVPTVEVTMEGLPKYTGFSKGEWGGGGVTMPELPLGAVGTYEGGKKKRRKRRGRRTSGRTEEPEVARAAIRTELEADGDVAAKEQ